MKAVIFDLEGTLLDVHEALYHQFETLTQEFDGARAPRDAIVAAAHGMPDHMLRELVGNSEVPFETIRKRHQQLRRDAYERVGLYGATSELLPILKRLRVKVAALSHGDGYTLAALERSGVHRYFDAVVMAEDMPQLKPHADGVQYVLSKLGVLPEQAVMVGDSVNDILAGKNAGVAKTIGVSHGLGSIEALRAAGADHIVHDIPAILDVLE